MRIKHQYLRYTYQLPKNTVHFFTANNVVKGNGELVMGAGNALAVKKAIPNAPKVFGGMVKAEPDKRIHLAKYGDGILGSFQTKENWRNPTPLNVLIESIDALKELATKETAWEFHLPCPAVSNGGMDIKQVLKLIEVLPDNVIIYI